jgi:hypothetical protein
MKYFQQKNNVIGKLIDFFGRGRSYDFLKYYRQKIGVFDCESSTAEKKEGVFDSKHC